MFILKLNVNGQFDWAHTHGSTDSDYAGAITTDASGNLYASGVFRHTVDFDPGPGIANRTAPGGSASFVQKLDPTGACLWVAVTEGGTTFNTDIDLDPFGNVVVAGNYSLPVDFDPGTAVFQHNALGSTDAFVWWLSTNGDFVWAQSTGGVGQDAFNCLATAPSGDVWAAGSFTSTLDADPGTGVDSHTSKGQSDGLVQRIRLGDSPVTASAGMDNQLCGANTATLGGMPSATGGSAPYTYQWSPATSLSSSTAANPVANPATATSYNLLVTDANGCTGNDTVTITPAAAACEEVQNLRAMNIQHTSVRLTWDTVCGAVKYKILYKVNGPGPWTVVYKNGQGGGTNIHGLTPDVLYRWTVKADCAAAGWGATPPSTTFRTLTGPCNVPGSLAAPIVGMSAAKLTWTGQPLVWRYRLRYRPLGATSWTVVPKDSVWTFHWLTGLSAATVYEWQIRSVCTPNGSGTAWSGVHSFTTAATNKGIVPEPEGFVPQAAEAPASILVFPNPTTGPVVVQHPALNVSAHLSIFDVAGRTVYDAQVNASQQHAIDLSHHPRGIYVLRLQTQSAASYSRIVLR